ncbi:TPA: SHIRT domain-containing protein, partial [Haemophilus influenzae]
ENTPAAEKKAGKVTIERVDLDTKPEIQAGEEFKIKIKWVADPGQTNLGGLNSELNFDINTMEYVKVETVTPDGMGNSFINLAAVKKGKSRFGSTPFTNKELEAIFTFKAKRNITAADNYNFVFKAFPAPDGRVRWYTEPDYSGPTPLISSWEGLAADGTISVKLAKETEATYNATYEFESATAGKDLPQEVKDLLPTDNAKYKKDDQVTAKQPTSTEVADAAQDGKWIFKGYEPAGPVTVDNKDVKFVGKWEFKANEHNVSYEFASATAGKDLPQEVKDLLPTDAAKYVKGAQVNAVQPAQAEVEDAAQDGKWVFKGYEPTGPVTVGTEDVKFVGKWEFVAKEHNVSYEFVSATAGKELPQAVKDLLPTDNTKYKKDQQVTATQPTSTEVADAAQDGKWVFKGYEPTGPVTVGTEDVKFVGKWEFVAKEAEATYNATYEFVSATAGKELPQAVKDLLPTDNTKYKKDQQVTATQPTSTEVKVAGEDGKWVFKGYEPTGPVTVGTEDVKFVGKWEFVDKSTPTPPTPPAVKKGSVVVHYIAKDRTKLKDDYT